ncbi:MAG: histidine--tRNA ligase [Calditrichaeota bacterium]|nr:histidine--tRNA ligase [Calditrichota bacterium]
MNPLRRIKGTQDVTPSESAQWVALENIVREKMKVFNYREMRTPTFEVTELFARGIGELTDIVSKEMYTFSDRSQKSVTLRPEMTAPIMRAYLENNLQANAPINKIFYIASLFRQENPQAGRLRQFHQYGAEFIGSTMPHADAETISLALAIFDKLGLNNLELRINTVADPESREPYKELLQAYLKKNIPQPSEDVQQRIERNPLRVLDSKDPALAEIIKEAPKLLDHLNSVSSKHYHTVKEILREQNISFVEDPTLVRGLDYYTHTVYEITSPSVGAQSALCGGGRYDLLGRQIGGKDVPAVGFAAGIERILMALQSQETILADGEKIDVFLAALGDKAVHAVQSWASKLRTRNLTVDTDFLNRSMKAQFREANRQNARFVLILGETELEQKFFTVKDMISGEQSNIAFNSVIEFIEKNLKN